MRLAPEGVPFVAGGLGVLGLLAGAAWLAGGGGWWTLPLVWLPIALWLPWFFRDPARPGPRGDDLIIAPADGRVVGVTEANEPEFLKEPALRISIFMNVFDVHVNCYPVSGVVEHRVYRPGAFVNAAFDKASEANERMSLGIRSSRGRILVRQIAGLVARRIRADAHPGETVRQGDRLGIIRFGSRVDTFARGVRPEVSVGDRTRAGETVIARWGT